MLALTLAAALATPVYFLPSYGALSAWCPHSERNLPLFDEFRSEWYGKHLRAASEPSLYRQAQNGRADSLRFTWLRTFDRPVIVRVDGLHGKRPRLTARMLSGAGGYAPGTVAQRVDRVLSSAEAADLRRRLGAQNPLALGAGSDVCDSGNDGSQWIVERATGRRYKLVDRWYAQTGPVRATGMAMLRLTGWKFDKIY